MKYIRTKDRIYEVDLTSIHYFGEECFSCWDIEHTKPFNNWHIIKQADTIEELCDYCIYRNCEDELIIRKLPLSSSWKSIMRSIESGLIHDDIKLAILTDKGLIYAAKMNEKGELGLL